MFMLLLLQQDYYHSDRNNSHAVLPASQHIAQLDFFVIFIAKAVQSFFTDANET